jgi:crotonobetainyl-CoA:carnitine CoA-transferase CaiB-like acyl-CoA transferase
MSMNNTGLQDHETMLGPYRVLDLADEKGLICGKTLGDLGADVIKIEPPSGDSAREIGPFYRDLPNGEESLGLRYSTMSEINPHLILTYQKRDGMSFRQSMHVASFSSDNASLTWPDSSVCRPLEWSSRQVI